MSRWTAERRAAHSARIAQLHASGTAYRTQGAKLSETHARKRAARAATVATPADIEALRELRRAAQARYRRRQAGILDPFPSVADAIARLAQESNRDPQSTGRHARVRARAPEPIHPLAHLYRVPEPKALPRDDPRYWQRVQRRSTDAPEFDPKELAEALAQAADMAQHVPAGASTGRRAFNTGPL